MSWKPKIRLAAFVVNGLMNEKECRVTIEHASERVYAMLHYFNIEYAYKWYLLKGILLIEISGLGDTINVRIQEPWSGTWNIHSDFCMYAHVVGDTAKERHNANELLLLRSHIRTAKEMN